MGYQRHIYGWSPEAINSPQLDIALREDIGKLQKGEREQVLAISLIYCVKLLLF